MGVGRANSADPSATFIFGRLPNHGQLLLPKFFACGRVKYEQANFVFNLCKLIKSAVKRERWPKKKRLLHLGIRVVRAS